MEQTQLLTAEDHAIFAAMFAKDFAGLISTYVPAAKRAAALRAVSEAAATRLVDYDNTMSSPAPEGFEEWVLRTQGIRRDGTRVEGTVIHVPAERFRGSSNGDEQ